MAICMHVGKQRGKEGSREGGVGAQAIPPALLRCIGSWEMRKGEQ